MSTSRKRVLISIATFTPSPVFIIVMSDESRDKNSPIFLSSKNDTSLWTMAAKTSLLRFHEIHSVMILKLSDLTYENMVDIIVITIISIQ